MECLFNNEREPLGSKGISVNSSIINSGKRVWSESSSESVSGWGHFRILGLVFESMGIINEFTDCAAYSSCSPLANQGYTVSILTTRKWTNNLGSLGFHSQDDYSPKDRKVTSDFLQLEWPKVTAFRFKILQKNCKTLKEGLTWPADWSRSGFSNCPSKSQIVL